MNGWDSVLIVGIAFCGGYAGWRLQRLFRFNAHRQRWFYVFWVWPFFWLLLQNTVPRWACSASLFAVLEGSVGLMGLLDFVYFYALKAPNQSKAQIRSLWVILLWLVFFFGPYVMNRIAPALHLPHSGQKLVWSDHFWSPTRYFFMEPTTRAKKSYGQKYEDPNYGKAIFSPLRGQVAGLSDDGFLSLQNETLKIELGPFVTSSIRLVLGQEVFAHQPLGLADLGKSIPGIELRILEGEQVRFLDVATGRRIAQNYKVTYLKRNMLTASKSPSRFRFHEKPSEFH